MVIAPGKTILDRFLNPFAACLTPEVARRVVELRLDPSIQVRLNELADKANNGELTSEERAEYEEFVDAIDLLTLLKAKARDALAAADQE